jgi:DNA-binding XRE family transcriptional regulator
MLKLKRPQIIEQDGRPAFAVVRIEDWQRIEELLEDLEENRMADEVLTDPNEEFVPTEVVGQLLDGQNPIRVWRAYRELTQKQLAAEVGIATAYLSQLENGRRKASQDVLVRLARALRVDVDDLLPRPD